MTETNEISPESSSGGASVNRRRLLKAAVATAPVIATLPSGAALARTSNLIGATSGPGMDNLDRTLCVDLSSGRYRDEILDLGPHADGTVTRIAERDYHELSATGPLITEKAMCEGGGTFYHTTGSVTVPRGIVVSATALSSFAGSITYIDV